jgi:nucleoside-diphosphate-sugar epimerase
MKVLVTGSSGFIGSALIERLRSQGYAAVGVDWRKPRWRTLHSDDHEVDINDTAAIRELVVAEQPEQIVHLAARIDISDDRVVRYNANIDGVANLMGAAMRAGSVSRILWTTSQLVSRVGYVQKHVTDFQPNNTYGDSKVINERIVRGLDGGGMEWLILRPTTVWGPGMSDHYLTLLRYLETRKYFHVGSAPVMKSFSYIDNAVSQIERLMRAPTETVNRQTYYIADYTPIDLRQWCDALAVELGVGKPPVVPVSLARMMARVGDLLNHTVAPGFKFNSFRLGNILTPYVFDTANLQQVTGPLPVDMSSAVRATVAWYRDSGKAALLGPGR